MSAYVGSLVEIPVCTYGAEERDQKAGWGSGLHYLGLLAMRLPESRAEENILSR